jgi:DNA-binding NarL/FixJ family response regulator
MEVLMLVAEGKKNKEIAEHLYISIKTVEKHRANLMRKLGLRNAQEIRDFAGEHNLVAPM